MRTAGAAWCASVARFAGAGELPRFTLRDDVDSIVTLAEEAPMIDVYSWPTPNGHKVHISSKNAGSSTAFTASISGPATSSSLNF